MVGITEMLLQFCLIIVISTVIWELAVIILLIRANDAKLVVLRFATVTPPRHSSFELAAHHQPQQTPLHTPRQYLFALQNKSPSQNCTCEISPLDKWLSFLFYTGPGHKILLTMILCVRKIDFATNSQYWHGQLWWSSHDRTSLIFKFNPESQRHLSIIILTLPLIFHPPGELVRGIVSYWTIESKPITVIYSLHSKSSPDVSAVLLGTRVLQSN